ncbi:hypothetical protein C6Y03_14035 [Bacillus sp. LNXM65]|uniref:hypothetical protein n=1 Tax=Bacillus sp. LNXM65 TaxID=2108540 RepID=UPI000D029A2F|nr:hypothetical protein [Bacillus sp. LNXM65]PRS72805.1 hypothetical protein C6Y03_14035 [Bacillus sp. LNXM65]
MNKPKLGDQMAKLNSTKFIEYLKSDFFNDAKEREEIRSDMQEIESLDEKDLNYGIAFMLEIESQILTAKFFFFIGAFISALSSINVIDIPSPWKTYLIIALLIIIFTILLRFHKDVTEDIYSRSVAKRFRKLLELAKEAKTNKDN